MIWYAGNDLVEGHNQTTDVGPVEFGHTLDKVKELSSLLHRWPRVVVLMVLDKSVFGRSGSSESHENWTYSSKWQDRMNVIAQTFRSFGVPVYDYSEEAKELKLQEDRAHWFYEPRDWKVLSPFEGTNNEAKLIQLSAKVLGSVYYASSPEGWVSKLRQNLIELIEEDGMHTTHWDAMMDDFENWDAPGSTGVTDSRSLGNSELRNKTFSSLVSVSVPLMSKLPLSADVNPDELSNLFLVFFGDFPMWIAKLKKWSIEVLLLAVREMSRSTK